MILAAGLGTRLQPLTDIKPKALVPVANRPAIDRTIALLKSHGFDRLVVNAHHHHRQMVDYLEGGRPFGIEIQVRVETEILGTGGGIRNTADFWDSEPFIVINSDILTDIDLGRAYEYHQKQGNLATLVLHDCEPFNQIRVDESGNIIDIGQRGQPGRLAFTGIHIINPDLLSSIPAEGFSNIIDCYRELILAGQSISGYVSEKHYWRDIGSIESYKRANKELLEDAFSIGIGSRIDVSASLEEWAVVGENTEIEEDAQIRGSILWEGVTVKRGKKIVNSIITSFKEVDRNLSGEIY